MATLDNEYICSQLAQVRTCCVIVKPCYNKKSYVIQLEKLLESSPLTPFEIKGGIQVGCYAIAHILIKCKNVSSHASTTWIFSCFDVNKHEQMCVLRKM